MSSILQVNNNHSELSQEKDDYAEKRKQKSFSPMKNLRLLENTIKKIQQPIERPPVIISSLNSDLQATTPSKVDVRNPTSYLLQHQYSRHSSTPNNRSEEQIQLIMKLVEGNKIWKDLGFESQDQNSPRANENSDFYKMLKEICNSIVLVWSQIPNITDAKPQEVYLMLEGKTFQYIHNQSATIKLKIHQNNDYIMVRKLLQNDYFTTSFSIKTKNKTNQVQSQKYQLMVDEKTLMGKISDPLFSKWIQKRLIQRTKKIKSFFKKVIIFQNLPEIVFQELIKFLRLQKIKPNTNIIKAGQKSKDIYFIKQGEVQFQVLSERPNQERDIKTQNLSQFDVFGMDTLHSVTIQENMTDYCARSKSECELYCIDKRILAIVISSFERELKVEQKVVKAININSQIKGQNYLSEKQQLLTKNVERIKTSEKKVRDLKLQNYSRKNKREINTFIPEKDRVKNQNTKDQITEVKFRASNAGFNIFRNNSLVSKGSLSSIRSSSDLVYRTLKNEYEKKYLSRSKDKQIKNFNHLVFPITDEVDVSQKHRTLLSTSSYNQFEKINKRSLQYLFSSSMQNISTPQTLTQFNTPLKSFVPKVQNKSSFFQLSSNLGKIESELINNLIEKKVKGEIAKKAEEILEKKNLNHRNSIKNIKKYYNPNSFSPSKKNNELVPFEEKTRKQLTDQLFQKMENIKNYPLLSLIESERKKMDSLSKIRSKEFNDIEQKRQKSKKLIRARFNQDIIVNPNDQVIQTANKKNGQYANQIGLPGTLVISKKN